MRKPNQPALRILGEKVRYYRKLKGLSQSQLADGICTQATVSLIEKRNKVPSMNILLQLIARLGISLDDIVVENHNRNQLALKTVAQQVHRGEFMQADKGLAKINANKLADAQEQEQYYYYKGVVALFKDQAPDEAIYYFGRVLNPLVSASHDFYATMATLGLGMAYASKHLTDRARVYIQQVMQLLHEMPMNEPHFLGTALTIYWYIGRIYFELADYPAVIKNVKLGIDLAVENDSLYLLDELYALRAQAMAQSGDAKAPQMTQIALALAQVNDSQQLVARLSQNQSA